MYTTILFDLDGTIIDPKEGITKSVQYALTKLGIVENNLDNLIPFIGPPLHESFQTKYKLNEQKTKQAIIYFRERYEKAGMFETKLYEHIPEMLATLQKNNKKLFIVTSKATYFAKKIIDKLKLSSYFTDIYGASMEIISEKKADTIGDLLKKYKLNSPHAIVMIGDREHDILAAKHHGIDSIGITYGYGSREELENAKPTKIINSPKELLEILLIDNNQTSLL